MKKIISIVLILVLAFTFVGCGKNNDKKIKEEEIVAKIDNASVALTKASSTVVNVWQNISSRDINETFRYMFSGDIKNKSWSGQGMDSNGFSTISWGNLAIEMNTFSSTLNEIKEAKVSIDASMDSYKNDYGELSPETLDYYLAYLELYNSTVSPSGNLITYSSKISECTTNLEKAKVKVKYSNQ